MARTIAIWAATGLATPTCKLMADGDLTTVVETITLTEDGTVKRLYTGTVTAAADHYRYNLLTAGSYIGGGSIYVGATDNTTYEEDGFGYLPGTNIKSVTDPISATVSLSQVGVTNEDDLEAGVITARRGDSFSRQITGLTGLSTADQIWFTVKAAATDPDDTLEDTDAEAILQVKLDGGLAVLLGSSTGLTAGDASITVDSNTELTIDIQEAIMAQLASDATTRIRSNTLRIPYVDYFYDIQTKTGSTVATIAEGIFRVPRDITRSTS